MTQSAIQKAIDDIFGPTEKGDFTIVEKQVLLAGKIAKHHDIIHKALLALRTQNPSAERERALKILETASYDYKVEGGGMSITAEDLLGKDTVKVIRAALGTREGEGEKAAKEKLQAAIDHATSELCCRTGTRSQTYAVLQMVRDRMEQALWALTDGKPDNLPSPPLNGGNNG